MIRSAVCACVCLISLMLSQTVLAQTVSSEAAKNRMEQWEIGPEIYYFQYKEPDFDVKDDGVMVGIAGAFVHRDPNHWMLKVDGHAAAGSINYNSTASGSINNIDDYTLEGRISTGYDILLPENQVFKTFFGVGYRYSNDDSSGKISSKGDLGYERESSYFYSPVGVEFNAKLNKNWALKVAAEYDIFWSGTQKSHLENVHLGLGTISNDQNSGYGVRGSVKLQKKNGRFDILIEPFVRWWNVKDSNLSNITYTGVIVGYAYEPRNESLETGGKISIIF